MLVGDPDFDASPAQVAAGFRDRNTSENATEDVPAREAVQVAEAAPLETAVAGARHRRVPRNWPRMPATARVIRHARERLENLGWTAASYEGPAAAKDRVLGVRHPRILQLATHGHMIERGTGEPAGNPLLRSMLILAGANAWTAEHASGEGVVGAASVRPCGRASRHDEHVARADPRDRRADGRFLHSVAGPDAS